MISAEINNNISRRVKCMEHKWDWGLLSCNSSLTWDIIESYPNKPWDWCGLSANPNMLLSNQDICHIIRICRATRTIQKIWRYVNTNPSYNVCQHRLFREYNEMVYY